MTDGGQEEEEEEENLLDVDRLAQYTDDIFQTAWGWSELETDIDTHIRYLTLALSCLKLLNEIRVGS